MHKTTKTTDPRALHPLMSASAAEWIQARDAAGEALARFPLVFRPASTRGLVRVTASGVYCRADLVARYRMAARELAAVVATWSTSRPADVFEAAIIEAQGDEAAALASLGLNYHDDRGDGLLHVPALDARKYRDAWALACSRLGIDSRATGAKR